MSHSPDQYTPARSTLAAGHFGCRVRQRKPFSCRSRPSLPSFRDAKRQRGVSRPETRADGRHYAPLRLSLANPLSHKTLCLRIAGRSPPQRAAACRLQSLRAASFLAASTLADRQITLMASTCSLEPRVSSGQSQSDDRPPCRPRRCVHVVSGEHYAGAERVQDLLALRLGDFGFEVGLAV